MKNLVKFLSLFVLILLCSVQGFSQERRIENEILVYIQPGYFELPDDPTNQLEYSKIKLISNDIDIIVKNNDVEVFAKAFPEFKSSDTISYTLEGNQVKLSDISRIFIFSLKDSKNKISLIEELSKTEGILLFYGWSVQKIPLLHPPQLHHSIITALSPQSKQIQHS